MTNLPVESNKKNQLSNTIANEIVSPSINTGEKLAEIVIDKFLTDDLDLLKEIPLLSSLRAIFKVSYGIKEAIFLKKIGVFLQEYRSGIINPERLSKFNSRFREDENYRNKVVEYIIVYNEKLENLNKVQIFSKLFLGYTTNNYDWDIFTDLVSSLNAIHPKGLRILKKIKSNINKTNFIIYDEEYKKIEEKEISIKGAENQRTIEKEEIHLKENIDSFNILASAGLAFKGFTIPPNDPHSLGQEAYMLTLIGSYFVKYGLS